MGNIGVHSVMPTLKTDIVLLGFRAVGKTTLGRYLAKKYSVEFIDLDLSLENKIQETLSSYAEKKGIESFREKEFEQLQEIFSKKEKNGRIISTGGAVVEYKKSYQMLKGLSNTKKLLLEMDTNALWDRIKNFTPEEERVGKIENKKEFTDLWERRRELFKELTEETIFLDAFGENSVKKNAQMIEKHLSLL